MNDERCDRDRVTAILTKCAKHRARWPSEQNPSMTIKVRDVELLGRLLEALDTIDKLEAERESMLVSIGRQADRANKAEERLQALNGGNESGDDR